MNIVPFLYRLKNSKTENDRRSYQQIVSAIKTVAPFFHDFYLDPTGEEGDRNILFRWTHAKHDAPFISGQGGDTTLKRGQVFDFSVVPISSTASANFLSISIAF
ncbi:MAG: hypothetical protein ACRERV_02970 [Methylococcales bacterium]